MGIIEIFERRTEEHARKKWKNINFAVNDFSRKARLMVPLGDIVAIGNLFVTTTVSIQIMYPPEDEWEILNQMEDLAEALLLDA